MSISPATLKRLNGDIRILNEDPLPYFEAAPNPSNMLEWYFLFIGNDGTIFNGGSYIGKILYPKTYPLDPPSFQMLTPSGRFMIKQNICVTASEYHRDEWSPAWTINSVVHGFISIFNDDKEHGISHIFEEDKKRIAMRDDSMIFNNKNYADILKLFKRLVSCNENGTYSLAKNVSNVPTENVSDEPVKNVSDVPTENISNEPVKNVSNVPTENVSNEPTENISDDAYYAIDDFNKQNYTVTSNFDKVYHIINLHNRHFGAKMLIDMYVSDNYKTYFGIFSFKTSSK